MPYVSFPDKERPKNQYTAEKGAEPRAFMYYLEDLISNADKEIHTAKENLAKYRQEKETLEFAKAEYIKFFNLELNKEF